MLQVAPIKFWPGGGLFGSEYVNTRPLARGDLKLLADQLILKSLARIGDLNFFKFKMRVPSGRVEFDPGE